MKLLMLSQYYDPEPFPFPHQTAKRMREKGHQVKVLTGFPSYPRGCIYPGYRQSLLKREAIDGVEVIRLPLLPDHSLSSARRTLYYVSLAASATVIAPFVSGNPDLVFSFPQLPLGIPAWIIGLIHGIPFVYNIQDIFPESMRIVGMSETHPVYKLIDRFAKFVYSKAAAISVISEGFRENLVSKGVPREKIRVIHSWTDDNIYRPESPDPILAAEYGTAGRFNVVFAGNMGPPQGLHSVIKAAQLLKGIPDIQFLFIGDGNEKENLEQLVRKCEIGNVRFIPRQPPSRMPQFFALADVLLVHLVEDPLFAITIPCKTQSYLACGKPILMAVRGDAASLVTAAGAGRCARPSDPEDIARALKEFYHLPREVREEVGKRGKAFYLENLSLAVQTEKYEKLFCELAENISTSTRDARS